MPFKFLVTYIHIHMETNTDHITPACLRMVVRGYNPYAILGNGSNGSANWTFYDSTRVVLALPVGVARLQF